MNKRISKAIAEHDPSRKVTVIFEYADKKEAWIFDHETDFLLSYLDNGVMVESRNLPPQIIRGPRNE